MNIKVPAVIANAWDITHHWGYKPIYEIKGFKIRRIDPIIVLTGIGIALYYWWTSGFIGALIGLSMFTLVAMFCMWM